MSYIYWSVLTLIATLLVGYVILSRAYENKAKKKAEEYMENREMSVNLEKKKNGEPYFYDHKEGDEIYRALIKEYESFDKEGEKIPDQNENKQSVDEVRETDAADTDEGKEYFVNERKTENKPIKGLDSVLDKKSVSVPSLESEKKTRKRKKTTAYLIIKNTGKRVDITSERFVMGKQRNAVDYCIRGNTTVSRRHCMISEKEGLRYVKDLGSLNYTYLNGERLEEGNEYPLQDGDLLKLSDSGFEYREEEI